MNDNQAPARRAGIGRRSMSNIIVGKVGPDGVVTFDDPEVPRRLRREAEAARRRAQFRLVGE